MWLGGRIYEALGSISTEKVLKNIFSHTVYYSSLISVLNVCKDFIKERLHKQIVVLGIREACEKV